MEDNKVREEARNKLNELKEEVDLSLLDEMLKGNTIEFKHKDKYYRARPLKMIDKEELSDLKHKKYLFLLQEKLPDGKKAHFLEKELIKVYKENGIDTAEMDNKITKFQSEQKEIALRFGEAIANHIDEKLWKTYEEQIDELKDKIRLLIIEKSSYLTYSLENELENYMIKCITYLELEEKIEENWKRVFSSIEELNKCEDEKLIIKAAYYSSVLTYKI